ncbi:MAG: hypothetical protein P0Y59_02565 [Candidatus Sphingomonas phytovorans]|nr:hypothetical protein [Sphingomonas sp.]WEK00594.1 MAG: hypothetical protein P0Y59_02565 [Sphingomonas sp.]
MADAPLLDLATLIVRQAIDIDGRRFEILSADELSVLDSHRFGIWGRQIERLAASDDADDSAEYAELIQRVARAAIVDVPDEVFARLTGTHQMAIVDVFTGLLLRNRLGVAGAMARAMGGLPTGETLFPGFSASTAAQDNGGWLKRLRHWFART